MFEKICVILFLAWGLFCYTCCDCCTAQANTLDLDVRSVDLYPSGARFVFAINAPAGEVRLELPGAFDMESVRLLTPEGQGFEQLQTVRRSRKSWIPPTLAQLNADYEAQKTVVANLNARESALQQTLSLLETLRPEKEQSNAKELIAYMKEAQELKYSTESALAELRPLMERENEKTKLLKEELDKRLPADANSYLEVTGRSLGTGEVLFEAHTDEAGWGPSYSMALDSMSGKIDAQLYATVAQRTGLDYTGRIILHTNTPDNAVRVPVLNPLRVDLHVPVKNNVMRSMSRAVSMKATADFAAADVMEDAVAPMAAGKIVRESITLTDRAVEGEGSLIGDGSMSRLSLGHIDMTCTPEFLLIPEQQKDAWLMASVDNAPTDLIPARAELFVNGSPAGNTDIPQYGISQAKLPFGRVPLLTAKKEPLVSKTGSSWFSGDRESNGYRLKITNGTGFDRTVTVRDRLPIPVNDKIKLEEHEISPTPTERDQENRLTWKLDIKAGQTLEILVDYTLKYPSGELLQYR